MSSTCGATPSAFAFFNNRMISLSVSAGRSVVRATSSVTRVSLSPHLPVVIHVSTIRCDACGATTGKISSVKRAIADRTFAVACVWCSSPNAMTPPGSASSVATAAGADAWRSTRGFAAAAGGGGAGRASNAAAAIRPTLVSRRPG